MTELAQDHQHLDADQTGDDDLFDGSVYHDPKLVYEKNGRKVDAIIVGFAGGVTLERYVLDDLELFKSLKEGDEVEFTISGVVRKDGTNLKKATAKKGVKLHETKTIEVHSLERA